MRSQDSQDKYAELDHTKAAFMPGDIIITHNEEAYHEVFGMLLIENKYGVEVKKPAESYSLEKQKSALVFFTKLPNNVSIQRRNNTVVMSVTM